MELIANLTLHIQPYLDQAKPYLDQAKPYLDQAQPYLDQAQPHINHTLTHMNHGYSIVQTTLYQTTKGSLNLEHRDRFQKFLLLNGLLICFIILLRILPLFNPFRIYKKIVKIVFSLPFTRKKITLQLQRFKQQFLDDYPEKYRSKITKIPYKPIEEVPGLDCDQESLKGYLSGSRYSEKKHSDFVASLAKQFSYSNPLHFDLHPHVKQMEVEVIQMCANMIGFHSDKGEAVGGFFSGGTESIIMAILAYREYGYKVRGIRNPNIVVGMTGHAAAMKAADTFQIDIRIVKNDKQYRMHLSDMKSKIDSNTVCVYASYPNYPYGTVDPIDKIASICLKKNTPIHLDMCLGGYLVPFLKKENGQPMFKVPKGVTSISADCHKYGLAAKGSSVLLFSSEEIRQHHYFATKEWPGGFYGTPGIAGSRTGATIASSWISMVKMGWKGFEKNAKQIHHATKNLATELRKLGFKVFGNPEICTIGFSHPKYSPGLIKDQMKKKNWDILILQKPISLHYAFTSVNSVRVQEMIQSFKQVIAILEKMKKQGTLNAKKSAEMELYGVCASIPDLSVKQMILQTIQDLFLEL